MATRSSVDSKICDSCRASRSASTAIGDVAEIGHQAAHVRIVEQVGHDRTRPNGSSRRRRAPDTCWSTAVWLLEYARSAREAARSVLGVDEVPPGRADDLVLGETEHRATDGEANVMSMFSSSTSTTSLLFCTRARNRASVARRSSSSSWRWVISRRQSTYPSTRGLSSRSAPTTSNQSHSPLLASTRTSVGSSGTSPASARSEVRRGGCRHRRDGRWRGCRRSMISSSS